MPPRFVKGIKPSQRWSERCDCTPPPELGAGVQGRRRFGVWERPLEPGSPPALAWNLPLWAGPGGLGGWVPRPRSRAVPACGRCRLLLWPPARRPCQAGLATHSRRFHRHARRPQSLPCCPQTATPCDTLCSPSRPAGHTLQDSPEGDLSSQSGGLGDASGPGTGPWPTSLSRPPPGEWASRPALGSHVGGVPQGAWPPSPPPQRGVSPGRGRGRKRSVSSLPPGRELHPSVSPAL